ncbi:hypothetical protein OC845_001294 [Tilletia horrida]|nr:hypothetical protein OC845_001294 [Tilletia horrida]
MIRPAFWRRKSEEEFLQATVVCSSKSAAATASGLNPDGSPNGDDIPLLAKPSCLKRSPSAPQRPPHFKGLTPLRSRSIAGGSACGDRRAVRFDSNPPLAAFTHSGKDYDRTPIECTQGKGGDLDLSLPPRCAKSDPDGDAEDDDEEEDREESMHVRNARINTSSLEDSAEPEDSDDLATPTTTLPPSLTTIASPVSTDVGQASPALISASEATSASSATSSVFGDSESMTSVASPHADSISAITDIPVLSGDGPSKWAAEVPSSTALERAMLRCKLDFGGSRWPRMLAAHQSQAQAEQDPQHCILVDEVDPQQAHPPPFVGSSSPVVTAMAASYDLLPNDHQFLSVGPLTIDTPSTSDVSVMSSTTLCSSNEDTLALSPSSVDSSEAGGALGSRSGAISSKQRCTLSNLSSFGHMFGAGAGNITSAPSAEVGYSSAELSSDDNTDHRASGSTSPTSPGTPPSSEDPDSTAATIAKKGDDLKIKKKKKKRSANMSSSSSCTSASGGAEEKTSAFACRRDFLLESTFGGALDGF